MRTSEVLTQEYEKLQGLKTAPVMLTEEGKMHASHLHTWKGNITLRAQRTKPQTALEGHWEVSCIAMANKIPDVSSRHSGKREDMLSTKRGAEAEFK